MSLYTRARSAARHRGKSPAELRAENDELACTVISLATDIDTLRRERNQLEAGLDQAGIDLSGANEDLRQLQADNERLNADLLATRQQLANATAISPLPQHIATEPIDCRPLRARVATGPVRNLWDSPQANPAHIPNWAT